MSLVKSLAQEIAWRLIKHLRDTGVNKSRWRTHRETVLVGNLITWALSSRNSLVKRNLRRVFPHWSPGQIKDMTVESIRYLAHNVADVLWFPPRPDMLQATTIVEGQDKFDDAIARGKGVITLTGHYGVFPLVGMPGVWAGRKLGVLAKDPHDRRLSGLLDELTGRVQMQFIGASSPAKAAVTALRILKKGGVVTVIFDQYPGKGRGVEVDLLGQRTAMYEGMVYIAAKSGAPLLPGVGRRTHGNTRHTLTYSDPIYVPKSAGKEGSPEMQEIMSQLAAWFSEEIYKYPEEWWWVHRRWRD